SGGQETNKVSPTPNPSPPRAARVGGRGTLQRFALEPACPLRIKRVELWSFQAGHVGFHFVTDLALQISEMAIAFREMLEQVLVERKLGRRVHRIESVLLVNEPAQHQAPPAVAFLEEVVEAAGTDHVADDAVDRGTL